MSFGICLLTDRLFLIFESIRRCIPILMDLDYIPKLIENKAVEKSIRWKKKRAIILSTTVQEDRNPYRHPHWSAPSMNQVATLLQTCARVFLVCRQILAEKGFKFHAILFTLSQVNNQQLYLRKFWEIRNAGTEYSEGPSFFGEIELTCVSAHFC